MTVVQLINRADEQVHLYEEDDPGVEMGETLLNWNGNMYQYDTGGYSDAWGDYIIYKEADVRAVPLSKEVK